MSKKFQLYEIQKKFIENARMCIKNGKTGIFSSPTGTGKTISLLLSIESYLSKNRICDFSGLNKRNVELLKSLKFDKIPIYYASRTHSQLNQAIKELKNLDIECDAVVIGSRALYCRHEEIKRLSDIEHINEQCRKARAKDDCIFYINLKNSPVSETDVQKQNEDELENLLSKRVRSHKNEYHNDPEKHKGLNHCKSDLKRAYCDAKSQGRPNNHQPNEKIYNRRISWSRQSIDHLRPHHFSKTTLSMEKDNNFYNQKTKHGLGHVMNSSELNSISEKPNLKNNPCIENKRIALLENAVPIIKRKKFTNHGIYDIEDLKNNDCNVCPYYKAKDLVKSASIVFLPYQMLLSKDSRESFSLHLEDSIVIIDEAHNIYESVIQMNSAVVYYDQLNKYIRAFKKYKTRLEENIVSKDNIALESFYTKKKRILDLFIDILSTLSEFCESEKRNRYENKKLSQEASSAKKYKLNSQPREINPVNEVNENFYIEKNDITRTFNDTVSKETMTLNTHMNKLGNINQIYRECSKVQNITPNIQSKREHLKTRDNSSEPKDIRKNSANEKCILKNNANQLDFDSASMISPSTKQNTSSFRITNELDNFSQKNASLEKKCDENLLFVNDFLIKSNLQNYNMLILKEHLKTTNLIQALEVFEQDLHLGLYTIVDFLSLLTNSDDNGLILYDDKKIRFTPLDARLYFEDIGVCKSLILAGGTMEPMDSLLRTFPDAEIHSYGSVCTNFIANILSSSPSGIKLRLTFEQRENTKILNELAITLKNLINSARSALQKGHGHGGIVCFVPSKSFLEAFRIILEPQLDKKLSYHFEDLKGFEKDCCIKSTVLFSVMGGRFSEGINFSDHFCRMLFIIGMPFPSVTTEISQRIKFYGKSFLLNIAMKTVNQALGRALRHKNDFASIVLIDQRFEKHQEMLSPWIKNRIKMASFNDVFKNTHDFLKAQTEKHTKMKNNYQISN